MFLPQIHKVHPVYLFPGLEFFTVEAVEQQGKEQVEDHEVANHQGWEEDC